MGRVIVSVVAGIVARLLVGLLWLLVFPALLINPAVVMVLGSHAHQTTFGRPEESLSTGTYLLMWAASGCVLVLFAATAFQGRRPWSEWTSTALVRFGIALFALCLGALAAAIGPGLAEVSDPLHTVAVYAGIVAWALLGAMSVTFAFVGQRGLAWLANGGLVAWGVLAFVVHDTRLAIVQVAGVVLGVAALAVYLGWLSHGFGFSIPAAIRHRVRTGRTIRVHPEIDKVESGLAEFAGEDPRQTRGY
jgi:hypothetical protein